MTTRAVPCPTCSLPTLDGVCRRCAFNAALVGLTASTEDSAEHGEIETPAGYDLLHELGAGASATVWLARERKLDRLVALKFIPLTADRQVGRRLVREAQAAARLRHPHIVAVHALGETPHHAYLAMDFLEGGDLRARVAREPLVPRAAAELVRKLADALAHAHASGVLHRDIKPSNVLLGAEGEPHLADFGLATPLEGGGDLTLPGQIAGTAAYLAPELLQGARYASPLSDVYGLGAVLYECLTGRGPFVGDSTALIFAQLARFDPPPARLLRPGIPRDLETICGKCLERSPTRRYASAQALHDDLARFLRGEPIAARPVNLFGKALRWSRRNPPAAAFAGAASVLLLGLALGGPIAALRLARANARATREAAATQAVSNFLQQDLLAQANPGQQHERDVMLRTVVARAAARIDGRFPGQPLVEADLRETLAKTLGSLGEYESARSQWERASELRTRHLGPDDPQTLRARAGLFNTMRALGKFREAEILAIDVLRRQRRVLGTNHPDTLFTAERLATIYRMQGKLAVAETRYRQLLVQTRRHLGRDHPTTLSALNNLALVCQEQGKFAEAEVLHRDRLATARRLLGPDHPSTLTSLYNLALLCSEAGKLDEAETLCREAIDARTRVLGAEHPDTLHAVRILAWILQDRGQFAEVEALDRRVLEIQRRKLGAKHPDTLVTQFNLGRFYREQSRLAEAEPLIAETLAIREQVMGPNNDFTIQSLGLLAGIYSDRGQLTEATQLATEAIARAERALKSSSPIRITASAELGRILVANGRLAEAEPILRSAYERMPKTPPKAWRAAAVQSYLGRALLGLHRYEEAETALQASYGTLSQLASVVPPANQPDIGATAAALKKLRTDGRRGAEATLAGSTIQAAERVSASPPAARD